MHYRLAYSPTINFPTFKCILESAESKGPPATYDQTISKHPPKAPVRKQGRQIPGLCRGGNCVGGDRDLYRHPAERLEPAAP